MIRHTLGNIVVNSIYCDTQPRTIVVEKMILQTLDDILVYGIYFDMQPRTIVVNKK